jgi:hypothetical protein
VQYVQRRPHHGPESVNRRDRAAVQSPTVALGRALRVDSSRGLHHRPNSDRPGHSRRSQAQSPTCGTGAAALGAYRRASSPGHGGCTGARRRRVTGMVSEPTASIQTSAAHCRRITVVGTTGSGKTTLACRLGQRHMELDALYWEPKWTPAATDRTRRRQYPLLFRQPEHAHLVVVRLRSPRAARDWLAGITMQAAPASAEQEAPGGTAGTRG